MAGVGGAEGRISGSISLRSAASGHPSAVRRWRRISWPFKRCRPVCGVVQGEILPIDKARFDRLVKVRAIYFKAGY